MEDIGTLVVICLLMFLLGYICVAVSVWLIESTEDDGSEERKNEIKHE